MAALCLNDNYLSSRAEGYVWRHMSVTWPDLKMRQVPKGPAWIKSQLCQVNDPNVGVWFLANNVYKNDCRAKILAPSCLSCQNASNVILFVYERSSSMLTSGQGQVTAGQVKYLDLGWSCCISLDSAAHSEHIGAFPDALAQFGQELLTKT